MSLHFGPIAGRVSPVSVVRRPQVAPTLTPENRDAVIAAFNDGRSYTQIAEEFAVARNVIAGAIFRARKRGEVQREKLPTRARRVSSATIRPEPPKPIQAVPAIDYTPLPVSFFDLTSAHCRYPLWKQEVPFSEKRFCGRPAKVGQVYCTHCCGLSFAPRRTESFDKKHGFFKLTKRSGR